jgi:hypothetical protein
MASQYDQCAALVAKLNEQWKFEMETRFSLLADGYSEPVYKTLLNAKRVVQETREYIDAIIATYR